MKRGEQDRRHVESGVGVRRLVHILQIMQRRGWLHTSAKPLGTERRKQSTKERWAEP